MAVSIQLAMPNPCIGPREGGDFSTSSSMRALEHHVRSGEHSGFLSLPIPV